MCVGTSRVPERELEWPWRGDRAEGQGKENSLTVTPPVSFSFGDPPESEKENSYWSHWSPLKWGPSSPGQPGAYFLSS